METFESARRKYSSSLNQAERFRILGEMQKMPKNPAQEEAYSSLLIEYSREGMAVESSGLPNLIGRIL